MTTGTAGQATKQPTPPPVEPLTSGFRPSVEPAAAVTVYIAAVHTGDIPNAGTDSDVWLWVDGTNGRSDWLYLDNADNNFERNRTDYFGPFFLADLGDLTAAWVYFGDSGSSTAWYLNTVTVNGKTFSYYNWLETEGRVTLNPT